MDQKKQFTEAEAKIMKDVSLRLTPELWLLRLPAFMCKKIDGAAAMTDIWIISWGVYPHYLSVRCSPLYSYTEKGGALAVIFHISNSQKI